MTNLTYNYVAITLLCVSVYCAGGENAGKTSPASDVPQAVQSQAPSMWSSAYWFPEQPHITECFPCSEFVASFDDNIEIELKKRMQAQEDYLNNRPSSGEFGTDKEKVRQDFLHRTSKEINSAKGRYTDAKKLKNLAMLEQCVNFLQNWPNYSSDVAKTKDLFAEVDTKKLPSQSIINKAKTVVAKDLTNQEAWELYDCEPCQEIKKAFSNAEGSFDAEKVKAVRSSISRLMSRTDKVSLPKTIAQKAEAVEACLTIIDARSAHEEQSKNLKKYLS